MVTAGCRFFSLEDGVLYRDDDELPARDVYDLLTGKCAYRKKTSASEDHRHVHVLIPPLLTSPLSKLFMETHSAL